MSLSVSSVNNVSAANRVSFGLAKFTNTGRTYAQECSDVYERLSKENEFPYIDFYKPKKFLTPAPFSKFVNSKLLAKNAFSDDNLNEVADAIVKCGTSDNAYANAGFVRQLIATKPKLDKLNEDSKKKIGEATEQVFKHNWDNPELTKNETMNLLEMSKNCLNGKEYVVLTGVISRSDSDK